MFHIKNIINRSLGNGYSFDCGPFLPDMKCMSDSYPKNDIIGRNVALMDCKFARVPNYGNIFASGSDQGHLMISDCTFRDQGLHTWDYAPAHPGHVTFGLSWSDVDMRVATCGGDKRVCIWNINNNGKPDLIKAYAGHDRTVKTVAFRPNDQSVIVSGGRDGIINLWDVRNVGIRPDRRIPAPVDKRSKPTATPPPSITRVLFLNEYTIISSTDKTTCINFWDLRKIKITNPVPTHTFECKFPGVTDLILNKRASKMFISYSNHNIYRYAINHNMDFVEETSYSGHIVSTFYVVIALSPDEKYLSCVDSSKMIHIWPMDTNKKPSIVKPYIQIKSEHLQNASGIAWSPANPMTLVTTSDHYSPVVWSVSRHPSWNRNDISIEVHIPPDEDVMLRSLSSTMEFKKHKPILRNRRCASDPRFPAAVRIPLPS